MLHELPLISRTQETFEFGFATRDRRTCRQDGRCATREIVNLKYVTHRAGALRKAVVSWVRERESERAKSSSTKETLLDHSWKGAMFMGKKRLLQIFDDARSSQEVMSAWILIKGSSFAVRLQSR